MIEDMLSLEANTTWDLVPLLADTSVMGSKWVYSIKVKSNESLDR